MHFVVCCLLTNLLKLEATTNPGNKSACRNGIAKQHKNNNNGKKKRQKKDKNKISKDNKDKNESFIFPMQSACNQ